MEVGPLARVLMLYASGHEPTRELANYALKKLDLPLTAMFSTLGRTAARTLESKIVVDQMQGWFDNLIANIKAGDLDRSQSGQMGSLLLADAKPVASASWRRRAARWPTGSSSRTARSPTTRRWCRRPGMPVRATPQGQPGPYEAALMDRHTLHDPKQPLEIQRTIHSFDPCIACAVHVVNPKGEELVQLRVREVSHDRYHRRPGRRKDVPRPHRRASGQLSGSLRALRTMRRSLPFLRGVGRPEDTRRPTSCFLSPRPIAARNSRWPGLGSRRASPRSDLREWEELLFDTCTMCGRCTTVCPMGIDIASIVGGRATSIRRGRARPEGSAGRRRQFTRSRQPARPHCGQTARPYRMAGGRARGENRARQGQGRHPAHRVFDRDDEISASRLWRWPSF